MKKVSVATFIGAGFASLSVGLASPAFADDWDITPVATGNDTSLNTAYREGGPQGTPTTRYAGPTMIAGGPADELPATSTGANPFVPLGPGH